MVIKWLGCAVSLNNYYNPLTNRWELGQLSPHSRSSSSWRFCLHWSLQTCRGAHSASYPMNTECIFLVVKLLVSENDHSGLSSSYTFVAWCLTNTGQPYCQLYRAEWLNWWTPSHSEAVFPYYKHQVEWSQNTMFHIFWIISAKFDQYVVMYKFSSFNLFLCHHVYP
jgi:hypothetical protein